MTTELEVSWLIYTSTVLSPIPSIEKGGKARPGRALRLAEPLDGEHKLPLRAPCFLSWLF